MCQATNEIKMVFNRNNKIKTSMLIHFIKCKKQTEQLTCKAVVVQVKILLNKKKVAAYGGSRPKYQNRCNVQRINNTDKAFETVKNCAKLVSSSSA